MNHTRKRKQRVEFSHQEINKLLDLIKTTFLTKVSEGELDPDLASLWVKLCRAQTRTLRKKTAPSPAA